MTKVGVGHSSKRTGRQAGTEAATAAVAQLGGEPAAAILVFANPGYDQPALLAAIRAVVGPDALIAGCSSEGVIYRGGSSERPCAVVVTAIASEAMSFEVMNVGGFGADPVACGQALAAQVSALGPDRAKAVFVFPDGVTGNCTAALQAFQRAITFPIVITGGAAGDMLKTHEDHVLTTSQYCGDQISTDSITVMVVGGAVEVDIGVSHGCTPLGLPRRVTSAADGWIHELDGQPAWAVMKEYLDGDPQNLLSTDTLHLCIGEPLDAGMRTLYGSDYVIRTPYSLSADKKSVFCPGGLQLGNEVQLTRRDPERVASSAAQSARALAGRRDRKPAVVLQFDCCGRGHSLFGERATEVAVTPAQALFDDVPWAGFYTFGEIAPIGEQAYYHNYTVVFCALYETA